MKVPNPAISEVFAEYLTERKKELSRKKFDEHAAIIELYEDMLNGYAYESLRPAERAFWEKRWKADEEVGAFCRTFGPVKILPGAGQFLGW